MELNDQLSSDLLTKVVKSFNELPGVGKKTALRYTLSLLNKDKEDIKRLGQNIIELADNVQFCGRCHNISDGPECVICTDKRRDSRVLCVVSDLRDVIAIENTHQFNGFYHVLGGVISPMEGIGPDDLNIESLITRVSKEDINELILGLSTTMEGDTTNFYIYKKLADFDMNISTIARGMAFGDEIEYTDEVTLGRSILNRVPYESSLKQ